MAYKRYIKRGGKVYGPYTYSSKKVKGKVVSTYHGKPEKKSSVNLRKYFFVFGIISIIIILALLLFFVLNLDLTGKVTADIKTKYQEGELLKGTLNFNLKQGELIPADSKVVVAFGNATREYFLSELVDADIISGTLFAEGVGDLGEGIGYGVIGVKKIYPDVSFELKIVDIEKTEVEREDEEEISEEEVGHESEDLEAEKINETFGESEEVEDEPPRDDSAEPEVEEESGKEEVEEIEKVEEQEEEEPESAPITGKVVAENTISGVASKGNEFIYALSESEDAQLVEGSVYVNSEQVEDSEVSVKNKKNQVVVSTKYFVEEQGFGEDYLGKKGLTLKVNLEEFDFTVNENAEIYIYLTYEDTTLAEAHESISVLNQATEEVNKTGVEETPVVNESELKIPPATNVTFGNITINTTQYGAVLNKPVKWKKNVKIDKKGVVKVEIPKQAENITVYKIVEDVKEEVEEINETQEQNKTIADEEVKEIEDVNKTIDEINETEEQKEEIDRQSKNKSKIKKQKITAKIISGQVSAEIELDRELSIINFFKRIFGFITGRVIDVEEKEEIKEIIIEENATEFEIEYETPGPTATETNISYGKEIVISSEVHYENILVYTELPREISKDVVKLYHIVNGTRVEVVFQGYYLEGELKIQANISESQPETNESRSEIGITGNVSEEKNKKGSNGMEPNKLSSDCNKYSKSKYLNVSVGSINSRAGMAEWSTQSVVIRYPSGCVGSIPTLGATENNSLIDGSNQSLANETNKINQSEQNQTSESSEKPINYIEWVVPHLSNQTYELIIEITKAEHLDENRIFIEDVYEYVKTKDDNWTEIPDGHYLRVTFEQELDNTRDITIYARGNGSSSIEVYVKNKTEVIATFESISGENLYKIYLSNLIGTQDVFDLKILNSAVEFDYIVDPVSEFLDDTDSNWDLGTMINMEVEGTGAGANLTSNKTTGGFLSRIFDASSSVDWKNITYSLEYPYGEELPGNQVDVDWFNMTGNVLLMHFNNDSSIGENDTHVFDLSGMGNNGTVEGGNVTTADGKFGNCFTFDGGDDCVNAGSDSSLDDLDTQGGISVSAWIYPYSAGLADVGRIIDKRAGQVGYLKFHLYGSALQLEKHGSTNLFVRSNQNDLIFNQWQHVTLVWDGSVTATNVHFYVDGVETGYNTQTDGVSFNSDASQPLMIGAGFDGTIDEVAIWNRSLSSDEIKNLYNRGAMKFNVSVRSCNDDACSGESWNETSNNASFGRVEGLTDLDNQYFQYMFNYTNSSSATARIENISIKFGYTASGLVLWDDSDSRAVYANYSKFYANYTDSVTSESVNGTGVWCEFRHNKTGLSWDKYSAVNMSFNSSSKLYELTADCGYIKNSTEVHIDGMPHGNYSWNVSCFNDLGYDNLSVVDDVNITKYPTSLTLTNSSEPYANEQMYFYANYTRNDAWDVEGWNWGQRLGQVVWNTSDIDAGDDTYSIAYFDCENKGKKDCVIAGSSQGDQRLVAFYPNGTQKWNNADPVRYVYEIEVSDLDNDGYENDIVIAGEYGDVWVFNESGDTVWGGDFWSTAYSVVIGDLDNDGIDDDFAVGMESSPGVYKVMVFNTSDSISWTNFWNGSNDFSYYIDEVATGDFDKDGDDDVVGVDHISGHIMAFVGDNGTMFFNTTDLGTINSVIAVDLDHDGFKDEIVVGESYNLWAFKWNGTWGVQYSDNSNDYIWKSTEPNGYASEVAIVDLDNDGWEDDIVVGDQGNVRGFDNDSTQLWSFTEPSSYIYSISIKDINNDGEKEIIAGGVDDIIWVLNRTGDLLWEYTIGLGDIGGIYGSSPATDIQDINNDGINDIAVASLYGYAHILQDVKCIAEFNDTKVVYNMTWNQTAKRWETNRTFATAGSYEWNSTCSKQGYAEQVGSGDFIVSNPEINISFIYPTENINVSQNEFFNITLNVSCLGGSCGTINVSLDPEMIEKIIGGQINVQVDEKGQIVGDVEGIKEKSFFDRVIEFVFSKLFLRGSYLY